MNQSATRISDRHW